jgi:hypothetical protein
MKPSGHFRADMTGGKSDRGIGGDSSNIPPLFEFARGFKDFVDHAGTW